jgi:DNA (cytosine-5)-methyltransferase 1
MNGLDLFSGIGGMSNALAGYVSPLIYCENDRYAQAVLLSRMADGWLPTSPIWDDISSLRGAMLPTGIDIIYGGFPCQGISVAGHGRGLADERSRLYWQLHRLVKEINPTFVFLENVPAIRTRGLKDVVGSLAELGYDCRWTIVQALEVGAHHRRARWFLLAAHPDGKALRIKQGRGIWEGQRPTAALNPPNGYKGIVAESPCGAFKPSVSRAGDGLPFAVDRDRCLGNAVVPQQARRAFEKLMGVN